MKNLKLSWQLFILFILIICLTGGLFVLFLGNKAGDLSKEMALSRLTSLVSSTKDSWADADNLDFSLTTDNSNIAYIRLIKVDKSDDDDPIKPADVPYYPENMIVSVASQNIFEIICEDDLNILTSTKISIIPGDSDSGVVDFNSSGKIYYAYMISENGCGLILLTNAYFAKSVKNNIVEYGAIVFIVIIMLSASIIFIWSKYYTTRLSRLNSYVKILPKTNYEKKYIDDGNDEIADLSKTINNMRIVLQKTENDKREMLQNLSHDFKTPIAVIKSYAEAIKDGVEDTNDGLDTIVKQAEILQAKVLKLLEYNKLEYLDKSEPFKEVVMKDIILNVTNNFKHQQTISIVLDLDDSKFIGYEENYYTVIENILDNAKRYAKSVIKITLKDGILTIYNDGDHIDEKFINGMFKAYEKGSKGEFGLGMSIVKKTLDFFSYDLLVKNEEVGVSFIIKKRGNSNINAI